MKPPAGMFQTATKVKVLSSEIFDVEEVDSFHVLEGCISCTAMARCGLLFRSLRPWYGTERKLSEPGRPVQFLREQFVFCGNLSARITNDLNGDTYVNIGDIIWGLKIISNQRLSGTDTGGDVDGDGKIGLSDVIHVMRVVSQRTGFLSNETYDETGTYNYSYLSGALDIYIDYSNFPFNGHGLPMGRSSAPLTWDGPERISINFPPETSWEHVEGEPGNIVGIWRMFEGDAYSDNNYTITFFGDGNLAIHSQSLGGLG